MTLRILLPFEDCARTVYEVWPSGGRPSDADMVIYYTPDFLGKVALKEKDQGDVGGINRFRHG
ncbi:hypothetical protein SADUNF_Sadunf12G0049200 [Salix dunnii]|uniref:Uncharacterized protein n=1 Tax=Salix dunnii TaxID=1413687 RepID=A0A835MLX3_9ROSI|nr:hypothetical protein SADUNF_Sadunf12G0049200 [Salix dunnii]